VDNFIAVYRTKKEEVYQYTKRLLEVNGIDLRTSCGCFQIYHPVMLCPQGSKDCPNGYVIYVANTDVDEFIRVIGDNERTAAAVSSADKIH
jgi:hypothetical protein